MSSQRMTLEEYLSFDSSTDKYADRYYELVAGELVEMPPESRINDRIVMLLIAELLKFVGSDRLSNRAEIVVAGYRATTRIPDLMVLTDELTTALQDATRSTITLDMPPPMLVVEVVSPGQGNENRDYRYKRSEYAARGIAEYWIVDPAKQQVVVLTLVEGLYEEVIFQGSDPIQSGCFPTLTLTVKAVLQVKE